jgi:hypothetical protein
MEGYQLRIALKDIPAVWRRVLVPAGITFRTLHRVIQFAMGWQDCHLHEFSSDDDPTVYTDNSEAIAENQYYLKNPEELQHEFMRSILQTPMKSSGSVKIDSILQRSGRLKYVYDLGDEWEHEVFLEDVVDLENAFPVCKPVKHARRKMLVDRPDTWTFWRHGMILGMKTTRTLSCGPLRTVH